MTPPVDKADLLLLLVGWRNALVGVHLLVAWMNDTLCATSDILGGFAHVNAPSGWNNEYLLRLVLL